ncbi:uncharacterized protein UV8b_00581 [Ustilaginoidea virens]|uniref:Uncharacterized protein n=1 Tax=Ustilaginoidea virens TaxID=1159556 RepID=A0A063BW12_USTVR|nr:uncharacterized protein UV8b_00581 [Ustilaginoidea virens]QUC16340.1 hypothetical protein UV8b_00581 [Ustilaginoidea virens]GAO13433.1 hypothetical protein UVI_02014360 [Ustilaginoidea virens]
MADYTLYAYFRSSCSARLRIILHLKGIPYDHVAVNLLQDEQLSPEHTALNPSASVPLLACRAPPHAGFAIGQSLAALEYLEEMHPEAPCLPPPGDARGRATVRVLCAIIAADTQPVTNLRIMRRVRALGGSAEDWNRELMADGLRAYEAVASGSAGRYSVGDALTMADACLVPAVWNARRFGVDLSRFPTVCRVVGNLSEHPAVQKADYFKQPDCPADLLQPRDNLAS